MIIESTKLQWHKSLGKLHAFVIAVLRGLAAVHHSLLDDILGVINAIFMPKEKVRKNLRLGNFVIIGM